MICFSRSSPETAGLGLLLKGIASFSWLFPEGSGVSKQESKSKDII
jgi:hypothetical protein